jgi:hypothetical protein
MYPARVRGITRFGLPLFVVEAQGLAVYWLVLIPRKILAWD